MRALIPCGGRGTRMAALAHGAPKEMLPVAGRPAIDWILQECVDSGIEEVLVVTAPGKEVLVDHVRVRRDVTVVTQETPNGLADAIRLGRDFAVGEPLAVALPDNIFVAERPALAQVMAMYHRTRRNVVAIVEITSDEAAARGPTAALTGTVMGAEYQISHIPDKGAKGRTFDVHGRASAYTAVGRYIFLRDVFAEIDAVEAALPVGVELDDVPLMQRLLAQHVLTGCLVRGRFLDVGLPSGYAEANVSLAVRESSRESSR